MPCILRGRKWFQIAFRKTAEVVQEQTSEKHERRFVVTFQVRPKKEAWKSDASVVEISVKVPNTDT